MPTKPMNTCPTAAGPQHDRDQYDMLDPLRSHDLAELARRLEGLCRAIAPKDLADVPVYIAFASELPSWCHGAMLGWTSDWADLALRPCLDWRGRGPVIVLDDRTQRDVLRGMFPDGLSPEKMWKFLCSDLMHVCLHELGHVLERDSLVRTPMGYDKYPTEIIASIVDTVRQRTRTEREGWESGAVPAVNYDHHGLQFTRLALHIIDRAQRLGLTVVAGDICAGPRYGLRDTAYYQQNLFPELQWMADASFGEIRATPVPPIFEGNYQADLRKREEQKQREAEQRRLADLVSLPTPFRKEPMMAISELLDKVIGKQKTMAEKREAQFTALVKKIADGREPDADAVAAALEETGKTVDDLRSAVDALLERRRLRAQVDAVSGLEAERVKLAAEIAAADAALEKAEKDHREVVAPRLDRLQQIRQGLSDAADAKRELYATANPALRYKLNELATRREAVIFRVQKADGTVQGDTSPEIAGVAELRSLARQYEQANAARTGVWHDPQEIASLRRRADELEADKKAGVAELATLDVEEKALLDEMARV